LFSSDILLGLARFGVKYLCVEGQYDMKHNLSSLAKLLFALSIFGVGFFLYSCGGGGGKRPEPQPTLSILSINLSPQDPSAGTVVELSATFNNPSLAVGKTRVWEVSGGTIGETPPDFTLVLRQTAGLKNTSAVVRTTRDVVYWLTPTEPGKYTVTLTVGSVSRSREVSVSATPIALSILQDDGTHIVVSVKAVSVTNLYQAAFRVNFDSTKYTPTSVTPGNFLGSSQEILFLGLTNQNGFVPVGITRKGDAPGVSGSGELARISFSRKSTSRSPSALGLAGFSIGFYVLVDAQRSVING